MPFAVASRTVDDDLTLCVVHFITTAVVAERILSASLLQFA